MATFTEVFAEAWREFNTSGIPATGVYKPQKSLIRAIGVLLDQYISSLISGIVPKAAVLAASTGNLTLSGEQTIDGVLTSASSVLVKDQSAPAQNGVYTTAAGAWSRRSDLDTGAEFPGATVFVQQGTVNQGRSYTCNNATAPNVGTDAITFILTSEVTTELEVVSTGAPSSGKGPAGDATGRLDISWLPVLFKFLLDEGQYGGVGDGLRNFFGVSDNGTGELVGSWPKLINDLTKRPSVQPKVYLAGDSRSDQCSFDNGTENRGWLWWLGYLTAWRFDFQPSQNYGVAGSISAAILDQAVSLLSQPPGIVICITSTNDRTSTSNIIVADQTIMNLEIFEYLVTAVAGHRLIWITDMPRGDGNPYNLSGSNFHPGLTDNDRRGDHLTICQWYRERQKNKGVYVADVWPYLANPTDSMSRAKDNMFYDGLHPGVEGGYYVASAVRTPIEKLLPEWQHLPYSLYDRYAAGSNTRGNHVLNGLMIQSGLGGIAAAVVNSPATGTVAQGWTVDCGAGMVATCSLVAVGDGTNYQEVSLVGATPSGTHTTGPPLLVDPVSAVFTYTLDTANFAEGDVVEAFCYAAYDGAAGSYVGLRGIPIYIQITAGGVDSFVVGGEPNMASNASWPNLRLPALNLSGVQKTPRLTIPASLTAISFKIKAVAHGGEAVNATMRFGKVSVRKVIDVGTGML